MTIDPWAKLHAILSELEGRRIDYLMRVVRPHVVTVLVAVPGERWEIEVREDASVEIERFITTGSILDEPSLIDLWSIAD